MAKKQKQAKIVEIPAIYAGLPTDAREIKLISTQCIVADKSGNYFRFARKESNHIVSQGIANMWTNFSEFHDALDKKAHWELHQSLFKSDVPEGQSITDTALKNWLKLSQVAADRTGSATPKDPVSGKKSTITTRKYFRGTKDGKPAPCTVETPQAKACVVIFDSVAVADKDGVFTVTEGDLKAAIVARASELKTRQDPWRIFQYYRPQLIKAGVIKHD